MRSCLQALAGVAAVFFVLTALLALFVVNLARIITDRDIVKAALGDVDGLVTQAAPELVAEMIRQQAMAQGLPPIDVQSPAFQTAVQELIPPEWVEGQTETAVDAVFDTLETGNPAEAQLELNTAPVIERLRGEPGRRVVLAALQSLPVCSEFQIPIDPETGAVTIPNCLPPGIEAASLADQVHAIVVETIDLNPALVAQAGTLQIPLLGQQLAPADQARLERLHRSFLLAQRWAWLLWLLPLGCLLLILLLAVRSASDFGHWWGWPLLLAAVLAFLLSAVAPAILTLFLRTAVVPPPQPGAFDLPWSQVILRLLDPITDVWLRRVYIQAGIMLLLGGLLIILGFATGGRGRREPMYDTHDWR
jgi:hypothetical protein